MPTIPVLDSTMAYRSRGEGPPFVLIHGNPTSSHLWRNILPQIGNLGRALAPDLIGMGRSGKPPINYGFLDTARYLDAWFDQMELDDVVLVGPRLGRGTCTGLGCPPPRSRPRCGLLRNDPSSDDLGRTLPGRGTGTGWKL